ncbi:MAG: hypothetical protein EZS28_019533 [Streblomastix strix]|uniref:Uncharacterized protein n=1 Tax=Streblomastix strix TaxID=222440 RepID=A0A5J4VRA1_9EUKA|nr:MAG: hypothetical protein EZS28_019533 [Streblomastix strix]
MPIKEVLDTSVGSVGSAGTYARSDHQHPIQIADAIPPTDSLNGSYGAVAAYARNNHSRPINIETKASNIPIVNGVGDNGTSAFYARNDQIYPQQLTYDGNITATKFIKTGGMATELLCANGDTKYINGVKLGCRRSSTIGAIEGQWIIFTPPNSSTNNPYRFVIAVSSKAGDNTRGLQISADGNTLTFNGRVL